MGKPINLQDALLRQMIKEKIPVTIFLTNGFQFKGHVCGFDSFVILIDCEGKQQVVYKHAVSTVCPAKNIDIKKLIEGSAE
ncbi:MAG: RNA chaperone Hfq [Clostridia bacterium]|nr:RNA chaperone Hfq [Clostridia bacterium]